MFLIFTTTNFVTQYDYFFTIQYFAHDCEQIVSTIILILISIYYGK